MMAQGARPSNESVEWTLKPGGRVHFVGIGGIGLSAIARILLEREYVVSGSDLQASPLTRELAELGATVYQSHEGQNIGDADLVVVSSAIPEQNPEILEARRSNIPVIKRGQMLRWLTRRKYTIAVAGTHGKTTTSAIIALILDSAGFEPTVVVGGIIPELGSNAKAGRGQYVVLEADEYDRTFLELTPQVAVVTSIEMDHPDCFTDLQDVSDAFRAFLAKVPADGLVLACGDDPLVRRALESVTNAKISTYGLKEHVDWMATDLRVNAAGGYDFRVLQKGADRGRFQLSVPGLHNVSNALAAIGVTHHLELDQACARDVLRRFGGVERRFQVRGEAEGITVVDDYAHHPSEIRATLAAARQRYAGRPIAVIFQPHTYSRTRALLGEFASAFGDADRVIITDIYPAREKDDLGVSARDLVGTMAHPQALYIADLSEAGAWLSEHLSPGQVVITMGAGDVWRVGEEFLAQLSSVEEQTDGQE